MKNQNLFWQYQKQWETNGLELYHNELYIIHSHINKQNDNRTNTNRNTG